MAPYRNEIELDFKNKNPKIASTLLLIYPKNKSLFFCLIQRNEYKGTHSNQISFPGGKNEIGESIKKIFEKKGEVYFRKFEEKITLKKLKLNSVVISLGGGTFTNINIRKEILKNHLSFWLNWSDKILLNRIKNSKKRPLAYNSTDTELIDLMKKRSKIYSKALFEIKCDKLSKDQIVKKILGIYENH